ncbi:unnamed protein product [Rotaria sp. Silwood1]|nr:unnamed protein product [Rotaria sp. Silwood1]
MVTLILAILYCVVLIHGKHFNGGTIHWEPIDPYANSSTVSISITQTYSWAYPTISCATNVPISTTGRSSANTNLTCIADCSTDGGYSTKPINILTDCISTSSSLGMMTSERSTNITLSAGAHFYLSYMGSAWIPIDDPSQSGLQWSITTFIDIRLRDDGFINTPPVASFVSPQYTVYTCSPLSHTTISTTIETSGTIASTLSYGTRQAIDECGGICYPNGLPNGTTLSNCTLSFTGLVPNTWYAVAIQVEDFINESSTTPMSSVPIQFLIYVMPDPFCSQPPVIIPYVDCMEVLTDIQKSFSIYAMTMCDPNNVDIAEFVITTGISEASLGPRKPIKLDQKSYA